MRNAEDDVNSFLNRFPNHERAADVKRIQEEIALQKGEQQLRASLLKSETLSPVEHDYLDAKNLAAVEPQRAIDKLEALINLYGPAATTDERTANCVKMARGELQQLRDETVKFIPGYQAVIDANLARAERLRQTSPDEAKAIWQGIITLYGDKPWAEEAVKKAKAALEQTK